MGEGQGNSSCEGAMEYGSSERNDVVVLEVDLHECDVAHVK